MRGQMAGCPLSSLTDSQSFSGLREGSHAGMTSFVILISTELDSAREENGRRGSGSESRGSKERAGRGYY